LLQFFRRRVPLSEYRDLTEVDPKVGDLTELSRHENVMATRGLIAGVLVCICGLALFILGVAGKMGFEFGLQGVTARFADASPGVVFTVCGVVIITTTRRQFVATKK
jgi:hypothetical protein